MIAHLFCSLPALHGADGEAESCSAGDVWNVHVVVEPLVPPVNKHRDNDDHNPYSYWCTAQGGKTRQYSYKLHWVLPGIRTGNSLGVDVITQLLSTVVYTCPDVDLGRSEMENKLIYA